ncbi:xanthine dehydrogenase accessory protein XdhC [Rhizobium sp. TH2]|uniref:xanthine dehydrogenase accessory protein XdhC n=1 Tax=Rhizobium sp. TH2 TaxID=2775403 RepID=UPI0021579624|nr:xanthine dehydrogenase accessory protein XdhC [Rhizobium sp. TH2]UVC07160.1 xanthine dehydrogenase accessory protein XdhC [Rhizobium sp. TH2]
MTFESFLTHSGPSILVEVTATKGSVPRETGTFMLVSITDIWGTIGGGNLEFAAIDKARGMLASGAQSGIMSITLGPDSGQCCGGVVDLELSVADEAATSNLKARLAREKLSFPDVYLFGAGHVGRALALALKPLPFHTVVIETRREELADLDAEIETRLVAMPESLVGEIRTGGAVVILTHDHALDFLIGAEALKRDDLAYVGMIGSKTKRGVFSNWLVREGYDDDMIDGLVLPIGGRKLRDKRPEVIAALVAAELLGALL